MIDFVTNLKTCSDIWFSEVPAGLVYYSHLSTALVSLVIGFFVFYKEKDLLSKILLSLTVIFSIWSILDLITWTSFSSLNIMFSWSILGIFDILLFIVCYYFFRVYIRNGKDINFLEKIILFILSVPIILMTPTTLNLIDFNYNNIYIEPYGLFGAVFFVSFLAYLIVKFKAFDIKLIATQALVWGVLILVGSQFFFIKSTVNMVLNGITLVISSALGLIIIRGVKREIALREDLEVANRNQESLIHFVSHQLKGFFTKSKMIFAGIVEGDFGDSSETLKDAAKEGLLSDDNAVSMIQDILGASNLKKGTTTYNMKEVDFADVVRKVCGSFKKEIEERGLEFINNIPDTPVKALADLTQITQVVKNLIDNSLKYTPKGSVEVSLSPEKKDGKDKVLLVIKDTGVGLSESDKNKLFTEGGKGDESLKVNVNSTGYGLYIVKKIVENHGGKIWAESDGRGMGSRFYVELGMVK